MKFTYDEKEKTTPTTTSITKDAPTTLRQRVEAAKKREPSERLILILDASGSMASRLESHVAKTKWELTQDAAYGLLATSKPSRSAIGLVIFETRVIATMEPSKQFMAIYRLIGKRFPGGSTSLSLAITSALTFSPHRIILISDGQPTEHEERVDAAVASLVKRKVRTDTVWIGDTHDEEGEKLLRSIAEKTGGRFSQPKTVKAYLQAVRDLETERRLLSS